jgi:hypothetical protein
MNTQQSKPVKISAEEEVAKLFNKAGLIDADDNIVSVLRHVYPCEIGEIDDPTDAQVTSLESALEQIWDTDEETAEEFITELANELLRMHDKVLVPHELKDRQAQLDEAWWMYNHAIRLKGDEPISRDDWNKCYSSMVKGD